MSFEYRFVPIVTWPGPVTAKKRKALFSAKWPDTLKLLERELQKLGATNVVIQAHCDGKQIRQDGMLRSDAKVTEPGVVVSFNSKYGSLSYPCDTFTTWHDNVRAVAVSLEKLRAVDRYGVTKRGEQYSGWARLPGPQVSTEVGTVHQVKPPLDAAKLRARALAYLATNGSILASCLPGVVDEILANVAMYDHYLREARKNCHPDRNRGDDSRWKRLEEIKQVLDAHHSYPN